MTERRGRGGGPEPINEMAKRLEAVRERFGVPSMRAFHAKLDDGWSKEDGRVSYEAVRNYHYDRDAPASYLARVAKVFEGVRLEYLVSGDGPMTKEEELTKEEATRETLASLGPWPSIAHQEGYELYTRVLKVRDEILRELTPGPTFATARYMPVWAAPAMEACRRLHVSGTELGRALKGPLEALGLRPNGAAIDGYILGMIPLLLALEPGQEDKTHG